MVERIKYNKKDYGDLLKKTAVMTQVQKNNVFNSVQNFAENAVEPIESVENFELLSDRVRLPYTDWIFGPEAIEGGYFGGNQGSLIDNFDEFIQRQKIWEIVQKYYPDADADLKCIIPELYEYIDNLVGSV